MSQPWSQRQRLLRMTIGLDGVQQRHVLLGFPDLVVVQVQAVEAPVAVAAPGIERAVVAGFLDRIEDVAELDHVAAPAAVADVDAGPRHVVERAVANGDALRQARFPPAAVCFSTRPVQIDQAVFHQAVGGVVGGLRAGRAVEGRQLLGVVVPIARDAGRVAIADKRHAVGAGLGDMAAADGDAGDCSCSRRRRCRPPGR